MSYKEKIQTAYDVEDVSVEYLKSLSFSDLNSILRLVKSERDPLAKEYRDGDSLCYPPDWYDYYVFPLDCLVNKVKDVIEEKENEEEQSEE